MSEIRSFVISRKISKREKETLVDLPSLQIQGLMLEGTGLEKEKKRWKRGIRSEVEGGICFGLVLLPRRKGSLTFTHSCKVTIYNRPPFLLLTVSAFRENKKETDHSLFPLFFIFFFSVSRFCFKMK